MGGCLTNHFTGYDKRYTYVEGYTGIYIYHMYISYIYICFLFMYSQLDIICAWRCGVKYQETERMLRTMEHLVG